MRSASLQIVWGQWLARWIGIRAALAATWEQQADRVGLWSPVLVAAGIGLFFWLPRDPPSWMLSMPVAVAGVAFLVRRRGLGLVLMGRAGLLLTIGFAAAQAHSLLTAPVALGFPLPAAWYAAQVAAVGRTEAGYRLTLSHLQRDGVPVAEVGGGKVRLSLRSGPVPPVGSRVTVRAVLTPVPPPLVVGGFDTRLAQFFQGITAHGAVYDLRVIDPGEAPPWTRWRDGLAATVRGTVAGPAGDIAVALAVGDQTGIAEPVRQAMRDSGLTHILSISGLHIGLVAALVMLTVRRGLAVIPALALRLDTKKIAVWPTAALVLLYGILAGWDVPVQRSVLMTGVVLLAILIDRTPLTLRTVAVAAFLVLLGSPEALLNPGFQMSFAAVIALIAAYERIGPWVSGLRAAYGGILTPLIVLASSVLTSLVATLATAPFTAYHFHSIALYGIVANLLAIPLTGFIIMPGIVLGFLLLPLGLDAWGWQIAGWGINGLIALAAAVAAFPGASIPVAQFSGFALLLIVLAGLWACLWHGNLRWFALIPLAGAMGVIISTPPPLFLTGGSDAAIAVPRADGIVEIFGATPTSLPARALGAALAAREIIPMGAPDSRAACDPWGCRFPTLHGPLALQRHPGAMSDDCRDAWGIVTAIPLRLPCPAPAWTLSTQHMRRTGPVRATIQDRGVSLETTRQSGRRWQPPERPRAQ